MPATDGPTVRWFTSSFSDGEGDNGNCVEVAMLPELTVGVRDSKDRGGPVQLVPAVAWTAFMAGIRTGDFDGA